MWFRILLKKWFNPPTFLVGDKVIVNGPSGNQNLFNNGEGFGVKRRRAVVIQLNLTSSGWQYLVRYNDSKTWWEIGQSLTIPYVEDLWNWEANDQ